MRPFGLLFGVMGMTIIFATCTPASALEMRGDTIYMIMVDRFCDGNPANNTAVNPALYSPDQTEWGKYFGGDLEGIRQKLDYLHSIGATAIWVTPVCENDPYLLANGTCYHGYDMQDMYRVEPHFGGWSDFDAVADGLHSRGMKLVLDVNLNNGGYTGSGAEGGL
jgi:cyclomaltodextrin glucanotransferase